jgi:hypothetical protein
MQLDDQPIPSYASSANATPADESTNQPLDAGAESELSGPQQRPIRTRGVRPNRPRWGPALEALLDRAHAAERQSAAALRAQAEANARLWRAAVAWWRVASFQGDGIPPELPPESYGRCYAQLIVQLGGVLKADGWQARLETVSPGPEAKVYALAILRAAMDGAVDLVEEMLRQGVDTLFNLGLAADRWLRDGLRHEVLEIRPPADSPFGWAGCSLLLLHSASQAGSPGAVGDQSEAPRKPLSTRFAGSGAEAAVNAYLAIRRDPPIMDVAGGTGLTEHKIRRTHAWKEHEESRLDAFLRDHPRAGIGDVQEALGFSAGKIAGMQAWSEHQARKEAAKPPRPVKQVSLSKTMLDCCPNAAAADPGARVADRDELLHTIMEDADPETRALIKRLTQAEREALVDYLLASVDLGDALDTAQSAATRALLVEITRQWLDEHEQEARHSRRGASGR